ncbi:hypothetical protein [Marinitoga sp. 38H-ov]|uniref:hypothetical protein n=1 Tax=Marinitoga sp. 38H-ov TaxID=1755814 RepID=UPI0013EBC070|nr:hypothetical protein [Marinitoga sp. 38H-ov]KAF2955881.1 hypothetical protein AS160_08645 [Marinitoga sp. 38H-ov]
MKKIYTTKIFTILFLLLFIVSYPNENIVNLFSNYSKLPQILIKSEMLFEVDSTPTSISFDLYIDNMKYFYFKIHKPSILSEIDYYYDLHNNKFYTDLKEDIDAYDNINNNLKIFKDFISILSITYSQDKFFIKTFEENNNIIYYFYPKSKNALRFLGIDYTQMYIYFKKFEDIYYLEKIKFVNSNNKKRVIANISITPYNTDFIKKHLLEIQ